MLPSNEEVKHATSAHGAGFLLYLLDVTFRMAQWMNTSIVTGKLLANGLLYLELSFVPVWPGRLTISSKGIIS